MHINSSLRINLKKFILVSLVANKNVFLEKSHDLRLLES